VWLLTLNIFNLPDDAVGGSAKAWILREFNISLTVISGLISTSAGLVIKMLSY